MSHSDVSETSEPTSTTVAAEAATPAISRGDADTTDTADIFAVLDESDGDHAAEVEVEAFDSTPEASSSDVEPAAPTLPADNRQRSDADIIDGGNADDSGGGGGGGDGHVQTDRRYAGRLPHHEHQAAR